MPFTNQGLYGRLKTILKRNGLPDIRFHDLRHTAASVMLTLNVPDKYAQARGGWATNHTMKTVYQHTMATKRNSVDQSIDAYYDSLLNPEKKRGMTPRLLCDFSCDIVFSNMQLFYFFLCICIKF